MRPRARSIVCTTSALLLLCIAARPALADGVFNDDSGRVIGVLVVLVLVVLASVLVLVWGVQMLGRRSPGRDEHSIAQPEIPVARTVKDSAAPPDATAMSRKPDSAPVRGR